MAALSIVYALSFLTLSYSSEIYTSDLTTTTTTIPITTTTPATTTTTTDYTSDYLSTTKMTSTPKAQNLPVQLSISNPNYQDATLISMDNYEGTSDINRMIQMIANKWNFPSMVYFYDINDRLLLDISEPQQRLQIYNKPMRVGETGIPLTYLMNDKDLPRLKMTFYFNIKLGETFNDDDDGYVVVVD